MSLEKNRQEAERWLKTAEGILKLPLFSRKTKNMLIRVSIPNGLPDLTPEEAYLEEDAQACIENAKKIIEAAKKRLNQ